MKHKNKNILNNLKGTGFKVPDAYFKSLEPILIKSDKTKEIGFKVPDAYFEDFEKNFDHKSQLTSVLSTGFTVPNHYFKNINTEISSAPKKAKVVSLLSKSKNIFKVGLAIAASLLLFFSISKYSFNNNTVNAVTDTELEVWMEEGLVSFDILEIEDVFSDEDLGLIALEEDEISEYLKYTDIEILLYEN